MALIAGTRDDDKTSDAEVVVPLKYLRSLKCLRLINCEIKLDLAWSINV